jgi:hypothetical protein
LSVSADSGLSDDVVAHAGDARRNFVTSMRTVGSIVAPDHSAPTAERPCPWLPDRSSGLRLWPLPDLSTPPLPALPREQLIAKLHSLTNLRAVRAPEEPTGWKIDVGPFPGWRDAPTW